MKKRFISLMLVICMLFSITAFASGAFSDVTESNLGWAINEIEEMTKNGIIKGYSDGTFRPNQAIKKIEALILASRVAGFTSDNYSSFTDRATQLFSKALSGYDCEYTEEVSYLLYKGAILADDLPNYLNDQMGAFKRYEAAILFTKIMGKDKEAKSDNGSKLTYKDKASIPKEALGYVQYMYDTGIMQGDDNTFSPNDSLTRAQVALMLYRVLGYIDQTVSVGTITSCDGATGKVSFRDLDSKIATVTLTSDIPVNVNGVISSVSAIKTGVEIAVFYRGDDIYSVEVLNPITDESVSGKVVSVASSSSPRITITDSVSGNTRDIFLCDTPAIYKDNVTATLNQISKDDFVTIEIKDSLGTHVYIQDKSSKVTGTVESVTVNANSTDLSVLTQSGEVITYTVDSDVTVKKNDNEATLRDILSGDRVTLSLSYGTVTKIVATATKTSATGIIEAITISSNPSITIKSNGESSTYSIVSGTEYQLEGVINAGIYDLRLGWNVALSLEGNIATKITTKSVATSASFTGVIESVNASYYAITLAVENDGVYESQQVFAAKTGTTVSAKIYNSNGSIAFKKLKVGDTVIVSGSYSNGIFEAKTIVVVD